MKSPEFRLSSSPLRGLLHSVPVLRMTKAGIKAVRYGQSKGAICALRRNLSPMEQSMESRVALHNHVLSKRGLDFIKAREACKLEAYKDSGGIWTIGFGHTASVWKGQKITKQQAEDLLRMDLYVAERALRRWVEVELTQDEYDALVSFIFNVGEEAFRKSTLLEMLNNQDYGAAADQFLRWDHIDHVQVAGLTNRRRDERLLFSGHYTAAQ